MIDHLLTDLQSQATAIVEGKPTIWERSHNLLGIALAEFVSRLDPIAQVGDIASLFGYGIGLLAHRVKEITTHPITTTQNSIATTSVINFITDIARFTSDTTMGIYYLSPEERSQRLESYWHGVQQVCQHIKPYMTAENIIDIVAPLAADIVFYRRCFCIRYLSERNKCCKQIIS